MSRRARFAAFSPCRMQPLVHTGLCGRRMGIHPSCQ
uniref:Uncharacterized protein n=1 Tax=Myoviridae sp. ctuIn11 TaxID=2827715 RepID=A0A8S5SHL4_9CAUD|nr:MAG TPA: hypothetical protein [Myoviridae sp. ctuIn11]